MGDENKSEESITMTKSTLYLGAIGVLAILLIASVFTQGFGIMKPTAVATTTGTQPSPTPSPSSSPAPAAQQPSTASLKIASYVPFSGSDSAKVNVVEFGDYQCPYCQLWFQQVELGITQDYVNTGKVKFYFLDFAFLGPDSLTLAQGAWCANEQGKYYAYHDYVYTNQGQENSGWGTPDKVKAMVANIPGIDATAFGTCLDSGKYSSRVQELTQFGQDSAVRGTPTILIGNDQKGYTQVSGYTYSSFKQAIDALLAG
jgi:protein-disulfide isomerase